MIHFGIENFYDIFYGNLFIFTEKQQEEIGYCQGNECYFNRILERYMIMKILFPVPLNLITTTYNANNVIIFTEHHINSISQIPKQKRNSHFL